MALQLGSLWKQSFGATWKWSIYWNDILLYIRACLHGGGGPQVGEVTRFGG